MYHEANGKQDDRSKQRKTATLGGMLRSEALTFLMEAHSGLSAKIVEEAGFKGIWASGLSISASMAVPDRNEASWSQVLEVIEFMADATTIPILVDGDSGYGDHNNTRRLAVKLCERGAAGVCIEDKLFPKQNSFLGEGQKLLAISDFCDKIRASKDSVSDPDFCFVARTETLIGGGSMQEALDRAAAYHEAGADAILIHSKRSTAEEIVEFCRQWRQRCPVVIVPTKYHKTPTSVYRAAGVSTVIWANHSLRASIQAMQQTVQRIYTEESIGALDDIIAPLEEVFRISGNDDSGAPQPARSSVKPAAILASAVGAG
ncbi:phosphoenolpyruvate phosphomutase [Burkholderia pyrrocinia]|uniref:phosphoenolpyruvate mutase n=1 Tax=Burkholderia stagnalis TaxID=1503054 RepID=UPI0002FD1C53|nr:phosphoenolpyruvate mutase [Burkholderia stagnalis]KVN25998.1 phosphoenolpyruvate phosphomutase [Burkholderia pyrrocinia]WGS44505.1 phosphoenolpyruvate mutase [Burkholderia sp. JSH-S8]